MTFMLGCWCPIKIHRFTLYSTNKITEHYRISRKKISWPSLQKVQIFFGWPEVFTAYIKHACTIAHAVLHLTLNSSRSKRHLYSWLRPLTVMKEHNHLISNDYYNVSQKNCIPKAGRHKFCYFPNTKSVSYTHLTLPTILRV